MLIPIFKVVKRMPNAAWVDKQIRAGTAIGINKTVNEGQQAVLGALRGTFTLRGSWFNQSNKYGIKAKYTNKNELKGEIRTNADWLEIHETGGAKTAKGDVAVPTDQVRRNKRLIIPRGQRPLGLGVKAFKLQTKHGMVLAQRITRGKRKGLIILYGLERSVRIRHQSTFYEPIQTVVKRRFLSNVLAGIDRALKEAYPAR